MNNPLAPSWNLSDLSRWIQPTQTQLSSRSAEIIASLTQDSRKVSSQTVFFAVSGATQDGHTFLKEVLVHRPLAIVVHVDVERLSGITTEERAAAVRLGIAIFLVSDVKAAFASALDGFWRQPSDDIFMIGTTGTNGKTTTTYLTEFLFTQIGCRVGVMGTIDHHVGAKVWETSLTTPGLADLYQRLAEFRSQAVDVVAMEVSSHALDQGRLKGIQFDAAVFTNLTRDHLDYHKNIETYHLAKQILFTHCLKDSKKQNVAAILNAEDERVMKTQIDRRAEITTFFDQTHASFQPLARHAFRRFAFQISERTISGLTLHIHIPDFGLREVRTNLVGDFNAQNLVAAICVVDFYLRTKRPKERVDLLGLALDQMPQFPGVRGRLQRVATTKAVHVFVDYAHTDDALRNVLHTLTAAQREQSSKGRLIVIFGCGGDRDRGKRPLMGAVACEFADQILITSDNPRTEDPMLIIEEILNGVPASARARVSVEPDRAQAIRRGVDMLIDHDILLVAGKGHETYQIIGQETRHFDDVEQLAERLNAHA